jgi:hypothetical protein
VNYRGKEFKLLLCITELCYHNVFLVCRFGTGKDAPKKLQGGHSIRLEKQLFNLCCSCEHYSNYLSYSVVGFISCMLMFVV